MKIGAGRPRRKPRRREQCGHGRRLPGAEFDHQNAVGREQRAALRRQSRESSRARRARRRAPRADRNRAPRARAHRCRRRRYTADWTRQVERSAERGADSRRRRTPPASTPSRRAFARATVERARLVSVPTPNALGNSRMSARRSAPHPVPRSAMRRGRARGPAHRWRASAASTTVSVSGRGTSVAAVSESFRLQNSLLPTMRATGSRAKPPRARAPRSRRAPRRSSCARRLPRAPPGRGQAHDR